MAKRGRPTKEAAPGRMASLGVKVTPRMKLEIVRAAAASGRSQSQEVEHRLARTFRDDELMVELRALRDEVRAGREPTRSGR